MSQTKKRNILLSCENVIIFLESNMIFNGYDYITVFKIIAILYVTFSDFNTDIHNENSK